MEEPTPAVIADPAPAADPTSVEPEPKPETEPTAPPAKTPEPPEPGSAPVEQPKAVKELIDQRKKRQKAELEAAYWRGVAEGKGQGKKDQPAPEPEGPPKKPVIDDFETYEAYEDAKTDYAVKLAEFNLIQKYEKEQVRAKAEEEHRKYQTRLQEAAKVDPVVKDALEDPEFLPIRNPMSAHIAQVIRESEEAPKLIRHLRQNAEEMDALYRMTPLAAARAIGRIEEKLSAVKPPSPKKVSDAPNPVKTVGDKGNETVPDLENMSMEQFAKHRNKEQFGARR